ncbi:MULTISPECIES: MFS transporter [unclassified Sulfurospirillum]|uniref:MFS transporter n=1 Tax=unclassified Sulfurospirillum TaxID=2618290 RepID=UPI0025F0C9FA|nr:MULTISPECIES: MFS transporter [unclassified Sulfurospirillum]
MKIKVASDTDSIMNIKAFFATREQLLYLFAAAVPIAFIAWNSLLNNFAIESAQFDGEKIGLLQSIREVPGLLAFSIVFVLLIFRQQNAAYLSLFLLGLGTFLTGFFPTTLGLYTTTLIMSIGFHYLETLNNSLSLQWIDKKNAPSFLGKLSAIRSFIGLGTLAVLYVLMKFCDVGYIGIYVLSGGVTMFLAFVAWLGFEHFKDDVIQETKLFMRKKYWLFYVLTFLAGARRQIVVVFAGFLLVEKFHFNVENMVLLLITNTILNMIFAPYAGKLIERFGEKLSLRIEYLSIVLIFILYGLVQSQTMAVSLYIIDNLFFTIAIALKTYFQKIADPKDIAITSGVGFTINHIAAVFLPFTLGIVWIYSHSVVFFIGAAIAVVSFVLTFFIAKKEQSCVYM